MKTTYYTDAGVSVRLGQELGRGGEGAILEVEGTPSACAKIYSKKLSGEYHHKLVRMVDNPPSDPAYDSSKHRSIAWPEVLLYADKRRQDLAGFTMPKIDGKLFKKALSFIDPGDRLKNFQGALTWRHLFTSGYNIASAVAAIHKRSYCIGDFNESNVLIAPTALITLLDCDSFQVADPQRGTTYRCPVGKPEYTAPELQGKSFRDHDRTVATDSFALAVMLFQLMMEGTHPYQAKGALVADAPNTAAKIIKGHFPYGAKVQGLAPPDHAPPFDILPPEIQELFVRCFAKGHKNPNVRPTALEWFKAMGKLKNNFHTCAVNDHHVFLDTLGTCACPWCAYQKKTGKDLFPSDVGQQVALAAPPSLSGSSSVSVKLSSSQSTSSSRPPRLPPPSSGSSTSSSGSSTTSSRRSSSGGTQAAQRNKVVLGLVLAGVSIVILAIAGVLIVVGSGAPKTAAPPNLPPPATVADSTPAPASTESGAEPKNLTEPNAPNANAPIEPKEAKDQALLRSYLAECDKALASEDLATATRWAARAKLVRADDSGLLAILGLVDKAEKLTQGVMLLRNSMAAKEWPQALDAFKQANNLLLQEFEDPRLKAFKAKQLANLTTLQGDLYKGVMAAGATWKKRALDEFEEKEYRKFMDKATEAKDCFLQALAVLQVPNGYLRRDAGKEQAVQGDMLALENLIGKATARLAYLDGKRHLQQGYDSLKPEGGFRTRLYEAKAAFEAAATCFQKALKDEDIGAGKDWKEAQREINAVLKLIQPINLVAAQKDLSGWSAKDWDIVVSGEGAWLQAKKAQAVLARNEITFPPQFNAVLEIGLLNKKGEFKNDSWRNYPDLLNVTFLSKIEGEDVTLCLGKNKDARFGFGNFSALAVTHARPDGKIMQTSKDVHIEKNRGPITLVLTKKGDSISIKAVDFDFGIITSRGGFKGLRVQVLNGSFGKELQVSPSISRISVAVPPPAN